MSECKLNHSVEDVKKKLEEQSAFLPKDLFTLLERLLSNPVDQVTLNEIFHLLKKYDLAAPEERERRDEQLRQLV